MLFYAPENDSNSVLISPRANKRLENGNHDTAKYYIKPYKTYSYYSLIPDSLTTPENVADMFFNELGIESYVKVSNGMYEVEISIQLINALKERKQIPTFFICTEEEYLEHLSEPLSSPS